MPDDNFHTALACVSARAVIVVSAVTIRRLNQPVLFFIAIVDDAKVKKIPAKGRKVKASVEAFFECAQLALRSFPERHQVVHDVRVKVWRSS